MKICKNKECNTLVVTEDSCPRCGGETAALPRCPTCNTEIYPAYKNCFGCGKAVHKFGEAESSKGTVRRIVRKTCRIGRKMVSCLLPPV